MLSFMASPALTPAVGSPGTACILDKGKLIAVVLCAALIYELIGPVITKAALVKAGEISPQFAYRRHKAAM